MNLQVKSGINCVCVQSNDGEVDMPEEVNNFAEMSFRLLRIHQF